MRKLAWILALLLMLSGCGREETFETISDVPVEGTLAQPREVWVSLPEQSALPVMDSENGQLYFCEDFEVAIQTLEAGDVDRTVQTLSGFDREDLTVIETSREGIDKYEFVWTMAGELGQRLGRATVLDDGSYHYCLVATIDAELISEYQEVFNGIFESFQLV